MTSQRSAVALAALVAFSGLCHGADARRLLKLESWPAATATDTEPQHQQLQQQQEQAQQQPAAQEPPRVVYTLVDQTGAPILPRAMPAADALYNVPPAGAMPHGLLLLDQPGAQQPQQPQQRPAAVAGFALPPAAVYYDNINPDGYYLAIATGAAAPRP